MKKDRVFLEKILSPTHDGAMMDWNADLYENKHDFVAEIRQGPALQCAGKPCPVHSCGTGTLTHALLEKSPSVVGLDASPEMIGKARHGLPRDGRLPHALEQLV